MLVNDIWIAQSNQVWYDGTLQIWLTISNQTVNTLQL